MVASKDCLTDVPGVRVGHAQSAAGHTGATVVLLDRGAIAGVDIGGSAPGMRETEMLNPTNMVMHIHAVLLTGGSTFGLSAAAGVQQYLQDRDIGFKASTGVTIPIVPTAVIFDLDVGKPRIYPDPAMGLAACENASSEPSPEGGVGVGIGATSGKVLGSDRAMRCPRRLWSARERRRRRRPGGLQRLGRHRRSCEWRHSRGCAKRG